MAQQIQENRTDLLDLLTTEELKRVDDLGLTLQYLAIFYDRPQMLEYLHKRGVDLGVSCDPVDYGTPMFYAITLQRHACVIMLDILGYSINNPCTKLEELPVAHVQRTGDDNMKLTFEYIKEKEFRAVTLFLKHYWRRRLRKHYLEMKKSIVIIQRAVRIFVAKRKLKKLKKRKEKQDREDKVLKKAPSTMAPVSKQQSMMMKGKK